MRNLWAGIDIKKKIVQGAGCRGRNRSLCQSSRVLIFIFAVISLLQLALLQISVVHQTVTFSSLNPRAAVLYGYPEERDTWFPGYAWTIACCRLCGDHIGWKFTAIENESIDAVQGLRVFW